MVAAILVHGMNANRSSWNGLEGHADLAAWKPVVLTLPGHGDSAFPKNTDLDKSDLFFCGKFMTALALADATSASMADYVDAVAATFPKPDTPGDVCLIGHSMGGAVISHVAAHPVHGARVGRLIYVSAMLPDEGDTIDKLSATFVGRCPPFGVCREFGEYMPGIASGLTGQPDGPKPEPFAPTPAYDAIPKHYIRCDDDLIICPKAQRQMLDAKRYKGVVVQHHLPSGHLPQYQDQDQLAKLIADILST